jgi:hypothetical protein
VQDTAEKETTLKRTRRTVREGKKVNMINFIVRVLQRENCSFDSRGDGLLLVTLFLGTRRQQKTESRKKKLRPSSRRQDNFANASLHCDDERGWLALTLEVSFFVSCTVCNLPKRQPREELRMKENAQFA